MRTARWSTLVWIIFNSSVKTQVMLILPKLMFMLTFGVIRNAYRAVVAMPCSASLQKIEKVDRCPRNTLEWDVRAALFNCSSINQTCVPSDMFLYHCVLNAYGTELLEVCAVYKFIYGNRCAEFDSEGSIVQENSNKCNNALVPCPMVYKSTEAFKYQSCYDGVKVRRQISMMKNITTTKYELLENSTKVTALFITNGITILVIIICGLLCAKKKFNIFQCDSQTHKDNQDTSMSLVA